MRLQRHSRRRPGTDGKELFTILKLIPLVEFGSHNRIGQCANDQRLAGANSTPRASRKIWHCWRVGQVVQPDSFPATCVRAFFNLVCQVAKEFNSLFAFHLFTPGTAAVFRHDFIAAKLCIPNSCTGVFSIRRAFVAFVKHVERWHAAITDPADHLAASSANSRGSVNRHLRHSVFAHCSSSRAGFLRTRQTHMRHICATYAQA